MTTLVIDNLARHPEAVDIVAGWIDAEWGTFSGRTLAETRARFANEPPGGAPPTTFVALDGRIPLGVASLRARDSTDWDPANSPWICNVYVDPTARGRSIAALLCRRLEEEARALGYPRLHLASRVAEGSVYERIGYEVYGSVPLEDALMNLMKRDLDPDNSAQRDWLARLVAFDTSSGRSNLPLIHHVRDYLAGLGVASHLVASPDGTKANLYAVIGPDEAGGIVLSGHTDVVPVTGQAWTSDPFTLAERDGKLYGRGTCDMKGFCATALALVPEFLAADLARPIVLAFSYDEEIGCVGAPAMIEEMRRRLPLPSAVIVGEPTLMRAVEGHKGSTRFRTHVTGIPAHSSETELGASAVEIAGQLIARIVEMRAANKRRAEPDSPFSPPYSSLGANVIEGGVQQNVIAGRCSFHWEARVIPDESVEAIEGEFEGYARTIARELAETGRAVSIETERLTSVPPFLPVEGSPAVELVQRLTGGMEPSVVSYASEAGQFQQAGYSAVICGPGSIEQAHRADEYVSIDQLDQCAAFMRRLIPLLR